MFIRCLTRSHLFIAATFIVSSLFIVIILEKIIPGKHESVKALDKRHEREGIDTLFPIRSLSVKNESTR